MNYEILIDGISIFEGRIVGLIFVLFVVLVILIGIAITLWLKLREHNTLKSEFITIIAHKFRTPLTHLKWLTETLLPGEQDAIRKESLLDINRSTEQLINLTGTLIELTNSAKQTKSSYNFTRTSLNKLATDIATQFKPQLLEKNISFTFQCDPKDILADIDVPRMEYVLQTLLDNSRIYTPPGRRVDLTVTTSGNKALLIVSDNGIGISPKDLPYIFSKFFRSRNAQSVDTEGFGVGLYMAQSIVKRHGGKIEVDSNGQDQGSVFRVILPKKS